VKGNAASAAKLRFGSGPYRVRFDRPPCLANRRNVVYVYSKPCHINLFHQRPAQTGLMLMIRRRGVDVQRASEGFV
jgi:hypothetical protein